jgi:hypothetical protein
MGDAHPRIYHIVNRNPPGTSDFGASVVSFTGFGNGKSPSPPWLAASKMLNSKP